MSDLTGKTALVTGASRGIGAEIAVRLAELGADVAVTYVRSKEQAEAVVDRIAATGRRGLAIRADSTVAEDITSAVDQTTAAFGGLDVLVDNAGVFPFGPIHEMSLDEIDRTLAIHARAAYVAAQAAVPRMPDGGRIISIGSNLAERVPSAGMTLYAMSKAALLGFTRGLARDLGDRAITVNLVQPGSTDTDMNPADAPNADAQREHTALKRYATPREIADSVAFLAGPAAANITGAVLTVDGGANA